MRAQILSCLVLVLAWPVAWAQPDLASNEVAFKSGNWYVVRTSRTRSGLVACTGFYRAKSGVQLTPERLIVRMPGEMREIVLQFGDRRPLAARKPEALEAQMGAVVIGGAEFDLLEHSKRLSIEVVTADGNPKQVLALAGLRAALDNIKAGCPQPGEKIDPGFGCAPALVERMKANDVTAAQIERICR